MFFSLAAVEVGTHLYWTFAGFTVHGQVLLVTWLVIATILAIAIAGTLKLEQIPKGLQNFVESKPVKSNVTGTISAVDEKGLTVNLGSNISGFIRKSNLAKDRSEQKIDRFAIGEKVDSMIISIDNKSRITKS